MFKAEEEEGAEGEKKANEQAIIWDDDAVSALLDRNEGEEVQQKDPTGEKKDWTNEYLSSFKVAQYVTKEAEEEEEPEESVVDTTKNDLQQTEPDPVTNFLDLTIIFRNIGKNFFVIITNTKKNLKLNSLVKANVFVK